MVDQNEQLERHIRRRDVMIGGAGVAFVAAGMRGGNSAYAQTEPSPAAPLTAVPAAATPGTVDVERRGSVLLIGINRPQAQNRLDPPILIGLGKAWYELERDDALRVAVLHGIGPDFALGLDVPAYVAAVTAGTYPPKDPDVMTPFNTRPPYRTKPVVVAVQGGTIGAGHELFLAADVRVAASNTRFRHPEVVLGVFPGAGATVRFTREAGWANAMRYMLTGDDWGAEEAYRVGVAQEVVTPGQQLNRALDLANKIAAAAPLGVRATLASARQTISSEEAAMLAVLPEFQRLLRSEDAKEGQRALREGRKPVFRGA